MKGISKIFAAALGVVALASCNNEDSFFGTANQNYNSTLNVEVAPMAGDEGEEGVTRAGFTVQNGKNYTAWLDGDKLRVYDENLQKYNTYTRDGGVFGTTGTQNASTFQLAPANFVSYAGWKEGTGLTALMQIPAALTYGEADKDGNTAYISNIPLFGKVTKKTDTELESSNNYLTGFLKVTLENGYSQNNALSIGSIKVTAQKWNGTAWVADDAMPLSGYFDAVLDPADNFEPGRTTAQTDANHSKLVKSGETVVADKYTSSILVKTPLTADNDYESVVYVPIVPGTYGRLLVEICHNNDGTGVYKAYALGGELAAAGTGKTIVQGHWYANADFVGDNAAALLATNAETKKMLYKNPLTYSLTLADGFVMEIEDAIVNCNLGYGDVIINVNASAKGLKTYATKKLNTITLPELKQNIVVNIAGNDLMTPGQNTDFELADLTITGGANDKGYGVFFNFVNDFDVQAHGIVLNTECPIGLAGDLSALTATNPVKVTGTGAVTLGDASTTLAFEAAAGKPVLVGDGTHAAGNLTVGYTTNTKLEIENQAKAANKLFINSEKVASVTDAGATEITIKGATHVTTSAATINIEAADADNVDLTLNKGVKTINLNNGVISNCVSGTVDFAAKSTIDVISDGNSAITCNPNIANVTFNYTAKYTKTTPITDAAVFAGTVSMNETTYTPIYTAAQLAATNNAAAGAAGYALMANITELNTGYAGADLKSNIIGNGKTIANIKKPLFGALTNDVTIDGINITGADIAFAENDFGGALAKSTAADVTVTNSSVAGSIAGHYYVGGYVGKVISGTLKFGNSDNASNRKPCTSAVNFTPSHTYGALVGWDLDAGTWGQFVGSVVATGAANATLNIMADCSASVDLDKKALYFDMNRTNNGTGTLNGWFKGASQKVGYIRSTVTTGVVSVKLGTTTYNNSATGNEVNAANTPAAGKITHTRYFIGSENGLKFVPAIPDNDDTNFYELGGILNTYEDAEY